MKKITLKITLLFLAMFAFQMQAQIEDGKVYTLRNLSNGDYLGAIEDPVGEYEMVSAVTSNAQKFEFVATTNNGNPAWNIVSPLRGEGRGSLRATSSGILINSFSGAPNTSGDKTFTARLVEGETMVYSFTIGAQTKEIAIDENNVPMFLEAEDFDTPPANTAQWLLEETEFVLNTTNFDTSSVSVSNPVSNQLTVSGLTASINTVSVYSILGQVVLTKRVAANSTLNLDVSTLVSGMYVVKFEGETGSFSRKIIKQ